MLLQWSPTSERTWARDSRQIRWPTGLAPSGRTDKLWGAGLPCSLCKIAIAVLLVATRRTASKFLRWKCRPRCTPEGARTWGGALEYSSVSERTLKSYAHLWGGSAAVS
jgi:hypothetical protein